MIVIFFQMTFHQAYQFKNLDVQFAFDHFFVRLLAPSCLANTTFVLPVSLIARECHPIARFAKPKCPQQSRKFLQSLFSGKNSMRS
mmetsp:Transcript_40928/g.56909  ORF Transcript_40928/g.56909 Transcript_40928/m.56909 type:complete len:86 (+) Transcript_40928:1029-1286(+)